MCLWSVAFPGFEEHILLYAICLLLILFFVFAVVVFLRRVDLLLCVVALALLANVLASLLAVDAFQDMVERPCNVEYLVIEYRFVLSKLGFSFLERRVVLVLVVTKDLQDVKHITHCSSHQCCSPKAKPTEEEAEESED